MDPDKKEQRCFERPKPGEMFDSSDPRFYASPEFQEVAMAVMWSRLYGHVRKLVSSVQGRTNHVGAQDLSNEAMRKTLESFPKKVCDLEGTPSARREYFARLLYRIARNLTFSFIGTINRREKSMKVTSIEDLSTIDHPSNLDILQSESDLYPSPTIAETTPSKLDNALAKLSEKDRDVLLLFHCEDISYAAIGVRLGCSQGAAKVRCFRALHRLKELLRNEPEFEHLFQKGGSHGR